MLTVTFIPPIGAKLCFLSPYWPQIFAICIVLALGLNQDPRTGRWRLLLMSEHEEMAWSRRKHQEVLRHDGPLILPPDDPRSQQVSRVTSKLVTALEEKDNYTVHGASWPPSNQELSRVMSEREALLTDAGGVGGSGRHREVHYKPSGTARSTFMPFRPATSNPLKKLETADWNLYVIDLPQMNAFALPSKDVFVYTGLLATLPEGDDSMLAAVLAHEIAHVAQRHSVENMGFLNIAAVAFDVLRGITFALTISFPMITDSAGLCINWVNDVIAERAYSRKLEQEADAVGLEIMATAGYDPRAAMDLWELMAAVEADAEANGQAINVENKFAMLRTHPTSEDRLSALEQDMPNAMKTWKAHLPKRPNPLPSQTASSSTSSSTTTSSFSEPSDSLNPQGSVRTDADGLIQV
ncbi:metalloendopeptidase [Kwoniella heveanensis BCC8398]|uniref:Metalloendopeptidase n=1 Tax=Kwoniella heveanensis BCC8398 TaxID=1296120 RepID=A0A1B9H4G9_9TREE|nr:metalloendopeptidase [Kwoniella heveanensis BCC8398]